MALVASGAACKKKGLEPAAPEGDPETSGAYEPPPLEMEFAEDADAAPAELAQADRDPDEETPAECFARCNRLRADLRRKARVERREREEARMAELEAAMDEQEEKGATASGKGAKGARDDAGDSADADADGELDEATEARLTVSVRECRVACQDKCVRDCVERGKRRDLFDAAQLEDACKEGCVVQQ